MARVLLIEDDDAIRVSLGKSLTAAGHAVSAVAAGVEEISAVARERPEVLLLDLGLPDLDGRDVLAMVRAVSDVPVIVATARDDDASVVRLLDAGADDYVIKPFSAAQMDARIRAVLRRLGPDQQGESTVEVGALRIDPRSREVTVDGSPVELTRNDKGPGIPLGAGERGRSDRGSTGLGLDIARRAAEAAGGHLTIRRNEVVLTLAAP